MNLSKMILRYSLVLMVVCLFAVTGFAGEFCKSYNYNNGDRVMFNELREVTIPAKSLLEVDGRKNGGIKVTGENRSDIAVSACVRTWAETDEKARSMAKSTRIETSGVVRAVNASEEAKMSVSYQIRVPTSTNLKLMAHNGGISINSVNGNLEFATKNGGLKLYDLSGNVKGSTKNGGVKVVLMGSAWTGGGLDVETKNGGVKLMMPSDYSANVETGTVNGGIKSDFPELAPKKEKNERGYYRRANKRVNASLNGGGAPIRVITTNGGVKISSSSSKL